MPSTPRPRIGPATRAVALATTLLTGLLGVLGIGPALASPAAAHAHTVVIKQYAYSPAAVTIEVGDTVTWTNEDSVEHDVMVTRGPESFRSPMLGKGESWRHTFRTAGTYSYLCSVHPDMVASVTVRPAASPTPKPTPKTTATQHVPGASTHAPSPATHAPSPAAQAPAATQVAAPQPTQDLVTSAEPQSATLDPLLLVAGASAAVMVFCLLLLTSRPAVKEAVVKEIVVKEAEPEE